MMGLATGDDDLMCDLCMAHKIHDSRMAKLQVGFNNHGRFDVLDESSADSILVCKSCLQEKSLIEAVNEEISIEIES